MCTNLCIGKSKLLSFPSTPGFSSQMLEFDSTGTTVNYGILNLIDSGTPFCCHNIGSAKIGMQVTDNGELLLVAPLENRFITVNIPTNTLRRPGFKFYKASATEFYIIGIDDIRGGFSDCCYKFLLNGNNNGVNIQFQNNQLIVEGSHILPHH